MKLLKLKFDKIWLYLLGSIPILFSACEESNSTLEENKSQYQINTPKGFPELQIPEDNELSKERIALGELLFFDKRLSQDDKTSCASCHIPEKAFADNNKIALSQDGKVGFRNVPTLVNVAYNNRFHMDGGIPTLEMQVMAPIHDLEEMGFSIIEASKKLSQDKKYRELALNAYNQEVNPFVITRAIACYERTIIYADSKFDRYMNNPDSTILTPLEYDGMHLFYSEKTSCMECHSGVNLTNQKYENIGLSKEYKDHGRERVSMKQEDIGKFKVPTLRNVAITYPYMHDGSIDSLMDVIEFFDSGGKDHWNKSSKIRPLNLSLYEKEALLAFLNTLTDKRYAHD